MRSYHFAVGESFRTTHWKQHEPLTWPEFVNWMAMDEPAGEKDCGNYVAGLLQETTGHNGKPTCVGLHRNSRAVVHRSIVTLDADSASMSFVADCAVELGCAMAMYTTWSNTGEKPRWRLLIPLSEDIKPEDYRLLVSVLMHDLGEAQFDPGSREPERLMHRPSTQGSYSAHILDGEPLDVEWWLTRSRELGLGFENIHREYTSYIDSSPMRDKADGVHPVAQAEIDAQLAALRKLPWPWISGNSFWSNGAFKASCNLAELANSNWTGYSIGNAERDLTEFAPVDDVWGDADNLGQFKSATNRVGGGGRPMPDDITPEQDFAAAETWPAIPQKFTDAYLCAWMARKGLGNDWCWAAGLGWMRWDSRHWVHRPEEDTREAVRRALLRVSQLAVAGGDPNIIKAVTGLLSSARINAVVSLMRGVVSMDAGKFDHQRDMLNCGNGVVNLETGELLAHDRSLLLTKITETPYVPGATHPDWDRCLTALDPEVADWMQVRFGQAATGWPTSDDILPIGQGGGSNGKSTLLAGLFSALGDHMVLVPDKLLRASPNDHPTELMSVFGARVAVIEETPEVGHLDIQRLKAVLGTERMTARGVYKDNVSWSPTHSLFLMSNYVPQVRETDHGTWRRLALVRFSKTFPKLDSFRANMSRGHGGRAEAVLAWVVEGSRKWYSGQRLIPEVPEIVASDTRAWRGETDMVLAFLDEGHIKFDPDKSVLVNDLLEVFNGWLRERGNSPWSANTLSTRITGHDRFRHIVKAQIRDRGGLVVKGISEIPARPWVWRGIGWWGTESW